MRRIVGFIHRWLGLSSGLVVFIVSVTGCLYAFQSEIQNLTQSYRFVKIEKKTVLLPSVLKAIAERELPNTKIHAVLYAGPGRAAQVIFYEFDPEVYYLLYLNPYSGEVLKLKNEQNDFFRFVLMGHFYLWLPPEIGQPVVASATLVFLVMLITGLMLWWPRNKNSTRQRFTIKWSARWRRKNYDLHQVLGFYASWIAILLAATGLIFGFQWFAGGVYQIAGGNKSLEYFEPPSDTLAQERFVERPAGDQLYLMLREAHPNASVMEIHVPESATSPIVVTLNPDEDTYWKTDYRYYDQYTLRELSVDHIYGIANEATLADNLIRMNYDIHTGAIAGLAGKILAFFASLIAASLPVTGIIVWLGRKKTSASNRKTD